MKLKKAMEIMSHFTTMLGSFLTVAFYSSGVKGLLQSRSVMKHGTRSERYWATPFCRQTSDAPTNNCKMRLAPDFFSFQNWGICVALQENFSVTS